jgi:hypothetical protein
VHKAAKLCGERESELTTLSFFFRALIWDKAMKVHVGLASKPKVVDPKDIVLKVTGSTVVRFVYSSFSHFATSW